MPPKKKSGKKKKGKKSGKKSARPTAAQDQLNELSKEFYHIQLKDLDNRLGRYQAKCDDLEVSNGQFKDKYVQMSTDKKEIVSFLKRSLEQRGDEIADINDRLIGLQQAKDTEKETYEQQLQQLRTDFQETKDQLTSENMILGGKLASLEEFKVQKEDLMEKMARLDEEIKEQEKLHDDEIYKLERKQVVDKDRLKKEMVMRVNQVAAEFRKVSNKQMAETTKRTIRENVSINAQLSKMSDKTMEMIQENDEVKAKEKKQRQQIDLLEANEKELAKKNHSNQKIIRMLTEKCKNQEAVLAEYEMQEQEWQEISEEANLLRQQTESSREEIMSLAKENEIFEEENKRLERELLEERKNKAKIEKVMSDACIALRAALTTTTTEDVEESPYDVVEKRDNMLENLLILLNSGAAVGVGPSPGEFANRHDSRPKSSSKIPGSGKGIRKGELPMSPVARNPLGTAAHYQLGDLGLIPRPKQHIPSNIEKMKELSATTRLGGLKKVLTKTVSTQTISSPKAMFFADQLLSRMPAEANVHLVQGLQSNEKTPLPKLHTQGKVSAKVF